jgi:hypothetical protein
MDQLPTKPTKRFQYRLKTLFVLTLAVALPLGLYVYWDEWRKQRPPYRDYDHNEYSAVCNEFFDDLKAGRLDHAYDSTSARFKKQMSRREFDTTIGRFLALPQIEEGVVGRGSVPIHANYVLERNWTFRSAAVNGPDKKVTEFSVWVLTDVADDSFFYRRPPPPRVEQIQVHEFSQDEWKNETLPELRPTWDQE